MEIILVHDTAAGPFGGFGVADSTATMETLIAAGMGRCDAAKVMAALVANPPVYGPCGTSPKWEVYLGGGVSAQIR